jgi:hypothetical protein
MLGHAVVVVAVRIGDELHLLAGLFLEDPAALGELLVQPARVARFVERAMAAAGEERM